MDDQSLSASFISSIVKIIANNSLDQTQEMLGENSELYIGEAFSFLLDLLLGGIFGETLEDGDTVLNILKTCLQISEMARNYIIL